MANELHQNKTILNQDIFFSLNFGLLEYIPLRTRGLKKKVLPPLPIIRIFNFFRFIQFIMYLTDNMNRVHH